MASLNKVEIIGNLGRDPEMRTFPSGDQVANVSIATTDRWKDKNTGEQKEATEWHRVVFNGKLAEIVGQYLRKGSQVYVEGALRTRKWTDQATGQERYATEIRADKMLMLGGNPQGGQGQQGSAPAPAPQQRTAPPPARSPAPPQRAASGFDDMDDDIPF